MGFYCTYLNITVFILLCLRYVWKLCDFVWWKEISLLPLYSVHDLFIEVPGSDDEPEVDENSSTRGFQHNGQISSPSLNLGDGYYRLDLMNDAVYGSATFFLHDGN